MICNDAWKILKIATLKSSVRLDIQRLIKEHDEVLNVAKYNGASEFIEELDKLHQILEDRKDDYMEIGEERDMLRGNFMALKHNFNEEKEKS